MEVMDNEERQLEGIQADALRWCEGLEFYPKGAAD